MDFEADYFFRFQNQLNFLTLLRLNVISQFFELSSYHFLRLLKLRIIFSNGLIGSPRLTWIEVISFSRFDCVSSACAFGSKIKLPAPEADAVCGNQLPACGCSGLLASKMAFKAPKFKWDKLKEKWQDASGAVVMAT